MVARDALMAAVAEGEEEEEAGQHGRSGADGRCPFEHELAQMLRSRCFMRLAVAVEVMMLMRWQMLRCYGRCSCLRPQSCEDCCWHVVCYYLK